MEREGFSRAMERERFSPSGEGRRQTSPYH
jgi:hypothetical protein